MSTKDTLNRILAISNSRTSWDELVNFVFGAGIDYRFIQEKAKLPPLVEGVRRLNEFSMSVEGGGMWTYLNRENHDFDELTHVAEMIRSSVLISYLQATAGLFPGGTVPQDEIARGDGADAHELELRRLDKQFEGAVEQARELCLKRSRENLEGFLRDIEAFWKNYRR